jgi:hypothetical protein
VDFSTVRILPILVAAIAFMVIGGLWYGPLFARSWMALIGKTEAELRAGARPTMYVWALLTALGTSYVLSVFIESTFMTSVKGGACVGLTAALGFTAMSFGSSYVFNMKPFKLYLIDVGYYVAAFVAAGAIIGGWR